MSIVSLYLKALGLGLAVAAPVGPMSLLCMRRTLTRSWRHGLATGFGIAVGDATFAAVAALGLAGVSAFMLAHQKPLHLAAGLFLLWAGFKTFQRKAVANSEQLETDSLSGLFTGPVLLTLTNPPTIIMFAALFAALAPSAGLDPTGAVVTTTGVFSGSLLWWLGVVSVVSAARHAVGRRMRLWIDRVSCAVLMLFGVAEVRRAL